MIDVLGDLFQPLVMPVAIACGLVVVGRLVWWWLTSRSGKPPKGRARRIWLYEHFTYDTYDSEVYIGLSNSPQQRTSQHLTTKPYFRTQRVTIRVTPFPEGTSRAEARRVETDLIATKRPPFNKADNPDYSHQGPLRAKIVGRSPTVVEVAGTVTGLVTRMTRQLGGFAVGFAPGVVVGVLAVAELWPQ